MRAARLVHLVLELQARRGATAATLARTLGVSVRTIYRDVEALGLAGVPVYTETGPGGGIRLVDGYQTRLTGLHADEATALGLAGVPAVAAQLGLGSLLVAAQAKVDAALPPELRQRAVRLRERFHADLPGWFERYTDPAALVPLSRAVWDGWRVDVRREGAAGPRRLDPFGLVVQGGTWYLVAARADDGQALPRRVHSHRIDRLVDVAVTGERAQRPDDFDLATWWAAHRDDFDRSIRRVEVRLRLTPSVARRLARVVPGALGRELDDALATHDDADTAFDLTLRMESIDVAHDQLLPVAGQLTVVAPAELRRRLADTARSLFERHGRTTGAEAAFPGDRADQAGEDWSFSSSTSSRRKSDAPSKAL